MNTVLHTERSIRNGTQTSYNLNAPEISPCMIYVHNLTQTTVLLKMTSAFLHAWFRRNWNSRKLYIVHSPTNALFIKLGKV